MYEHLGGPSALLLLQQPLSSGKLFSRKEEQEDQLPYEQHDRQQQQRMREQQRRTRQRHMLETQRERALSRSALSCLLHLGKSLLSAKLEKTPVAFCLVRASRTAQVATLHFSVFLRSSGVENGAAIESRNE